MVALGSPHPFLLFSNTVHLPQPGCPDGLPYNQMKFFTPESTAKVLIAVCVIYLLHALVIEAVQSHFMDPLRRSSEWGFLKGFSRKMLPYVVIPLFFTFFGFGVRLLPSPALQSILKNPPIDSRQDSPYNGPAVLGVDNVTEAEIALGFVGAIIVCCTVRIIAAVEKANVVWTISYVMLALIGCSVYTFLFVSDFYRIFFDSILRLRFPNSLPWMSLTGVAAGLITEFMLDRFPYRQD